MTSPVNRPTMNLAEADAVYAPLHRLSPPDGIAIERDVPYGPDPRHLLDVASPPTVAAMRPVLVFVHGGAFVAGERRRPGTPFHDNVMLWAAEQGWVGVNLTYRLAPRHPWPAGGDDVLRAMRWLQNHLSRWNGDPNRTFLFGHSAGAAHAAEALVRSATDDAAAAWAGTLLLSG
ncbi:MAG: alpha/beta hydrolase, partial [Gammaproteobacteria bacterium]|nr:alpha/beta hydrolase [Gammaproteobacteria bacterium]